jgi:hypothetical protein
MEHKMNILKAQKRDKARGKRNKMVVSNKSIFVIQQAIITRAEKAKGLKMKTTIITNANPETKLVMHKVELSQFAHYADFKKFCEDNKVNGDYELLWFSLTIVKGMNLFSPKGELK